jgi:hypothetical protein
VPLPDSIYRRNMHDLGIGEETDASLESISGGPTPDSLGEDRILTGGERASP